MDKALYIAMTGASHNMRAQTVHANNLANASTDGFFRDYVQARSMPVYYGEGHPTRAYALAENPATDFGQGVLKQTGRELDIAVKDEGWIAVQTEEGGEAYVKSASMQVDPFGVLRTADGLAVLGNGGPIALPPYEKVEIGDDGTITIRGAGQGPEVLATVNRVKLVNPAAEDLRKRDDGMVVRTDEGIEPVAAEIGVVSGFVSGSNVNAVEAVTEMLSLSRQYEMQVKMMGTIDSNTQASSRLMRIS